MTYGEANGRTRAEAKGDLKEASKIACSFCHDQEFHLNYEELFVMFKTEALQHAMINSEATKAKW